MILNSISSKNTNRLTSYDLKKDTSFKGVPINNKTLGCSAAAATAIMSAIMGLMQVKSSLENASLVEDTDTKLLYTPIETIKENLLEQINNIESVNGDFPDELKQKMINSIKNNNFNLKGIYDEYYSTLNLCQTLEEVSELYPHIIYPKTPKTAQQKEGVTLRFTSIDLKKESDINKLLQGVSVELGRRYHDSNEIEKSLKFLKENSEFKNAEEIVNTAKCVNTKDSLPRFMKILNSMYNENTAEYMTDERVIGLLTVMSAYYKPKANLNILKFYNILISNPNDDINKMLIDTLSSGKNTLIASMISGAKNDDELNQILSLIKDWGLSSLVLKNPRESLDLYSISKNQAAAKDLFRMFSSYNVKEAVKLIKQNPEAGKILDNYQTIIPEDAQTVEKEDVVKILNNMGISTDKDIHRIIGSIFPSEEWRPLASKKAFERRFEGQDYDKAIISAIKQIYLEGKSLTNVIIPIGENDFGYAINFNRYRGDEVIWSSPNKDILKIIKQSDNIHTELTELKTHLSKINEDGYKQLARKNATVNYWRDFSDYTRCNWMPIRLIKDRKYNENSLYNLDNLAKSYLYNLYQEAKNNPEVKLEYPANPLEEAGKSKHLNKYMRSVINSAYINIYNARHDDKSYIYFTGTTYYPAGISDIAQFEKFCQDNNFDIEGIKKSFQNIEEVYHKRFYRMYHFDKDRFKILQEDMNKALALVYEKRDFEGTKTTAQNISTNDVNQAIEEIEGTEGVDEKVNPEDLNKLTYIVQNIKNAELKQRCLSCISVEHIDADYFKYVYDIIQKSIEKDEKGKESLNEIKALVLFKLGDKYLESCNEAISMEEFIEKELKDYKLPNEEYDYERYYNDISAELDFFSYTAEVESLNEEEFSNFVTDLVINNTITYQDANSLLQDFLLIPDKMRSIVRTEVEKIGSTASVKEQNKIQSIINMINSWHADCAEIVSLNDAGVNKKVIITSNAKMQMWEKYNGNYVLFDQQLKKFYNAAKKYAADRGDNGIKTIRKDGSAELKVLGEGGGMRMYSRPILPEDIELFKQDANDKTPIKYIFDSYGKHL